jgi:ABC-type polysaccharide/polyol phosphate transport system ATPase subunit
MPAIRVENLSKRYRIYDRPTDKLREMVRLAGSARHREFWALRDVSFAVEPGQTIAVIGQNGSGKSTLLQILAGIMRQTRGECHVAGKISALLELGSGFNPEFTGRENVFMNGAILGFDERQMKERFDAVAQFAEIGSFMEQPVKTYSSGMFMRLAFAVAINVDPDVLLVDEALAVGDLVFQHRCMHRMNRLRENGKTIVLATHDLTAVTKFCDRAILLDGGTLLFDGKPDLAVQKYRALVFERERRYAQIEGDRDGILQAEYGSGGELPVARTIPNIDHRYGSGEASLLGVDLLTENGCPTREIRGGQKITVRISAEFNSAVERPILGFTLRDRLGVDISACNTSYEGRFLPPARAGQIFTADFHIQLPRLAIGSYSISPAVAKGDLVRHDMCDWIDNALVFHLGDEDMIYGVFRMEVEVRNYVSESASPGQ